MSSYFPYFVKFEFKKILTLKNFNLHMKHVIAFKSAFKGPLVVQTMDSFENFTGGIFNCR